MKDYRAMGFTPRFCQEAMIEELQELFKGKKFIGQENRKALKFFKQDLPISDDYDRDADADIASAPYIVVQLNSVTIPDENSTAIIDLSLVICAYDASLERAGFFDVVNIAQDILQHFASRPFFGGCFTVETPMKFVTQQDDTSPYYYGAVALPNVTCPVINTETEMSAFV